MMREKQKLLFLLKRSHWENKTCTLSGMLGYD